MTSMPTASNLLAGFEKRATEMGKGEGGMRVMS